MEQLPPPGSDVTGILTSRRPDGGRSMWRAQPPAAGGCGLWVAWLSLVLGSLGAYVSLRPARLCPAVPVSEASDLRAPRGQRPARPPLLPSRRVCSAPWPRGARLWHRNRPAWPWLGSLRGRLVAQGLRVALREPTEEKEPGPGAGWGSPARACSRPAGKDSRVATLELREVRPRRWDCQALIPTAAKLNV